jgi:hypothetical protein
VVKVGTSNTLPLIAVSLSHARDVGFCMWENFSASLRKVNGSTLVPVKVSWDYSSTSKALWWQDVPCMSGYVYQHLILNYISP